ncbi:MAG: hypothetical protein HRS57_02710, partial [Mycoplasmataceae bacterium]|nr:hypothetical protein [Mycoplasmataceae bacterium]
MSNASLILIIIFSVIVFLQILFAIFGYFYDVVFNKKGKRDIWKGKYNVIFVTGQKGIGKTHYIRNDFLSFFKKIRTNTISLHQILEMKSKNENGKKYWNTPNSIWGLLFLILSVLTILFVKIPKIYIIEDLNRVEDDRMDFLKEFISRKMYFSKTFNWRRRIIFIIEIEQEARYIKNEISKLAKKTKAIEVKLTRDKMDEILKEQKYDIIFDTEIKSAIVNLEFITPRFLIRYVNYLKEQYDENYEKIYGREQLFSTSLIPYTNEIAEDYKYDRYPTVYRDSQDKIKVKIEETSSYASENFLEIIMKKNYLNYKNFAPYFFARTYNLLILEKKVVNLNEFIINKEENAILTRNIINILNRDIRIFKNREISIEYKNYYSYSFLENLRLFVEKNDCNKV